MKRITPTVKLFKQIGNEQQWKCNKCESPFDSTVQIDHVFPLQYGGDNDRSNLRILCVSCHAKKTQDETTRQPLTNNNELSEYLNKKKEIHNQLQSDVESAIDRYHKAQKELVTPGNHAIRRREICEALHQLKEGLTRLSTTGKFSFNQDYTIRWRVNGKDISEIPWPYLCRSGLRVNPDKYLGVIHQTRERFRKTIKDYLAEH